MQLLKMAFAAIREVDVPMFCQKIIMAMAREICSADTRFWMAM
jgi:hypothetical protein